MLVAQQLQYDGYDGDNKRQRYRRDGINLGIKLEVKGNKDTSRTGKTALSDTVTLDSKAVTQSS